MPRIDRVAGEYHVKITYHAPSLAGRVTNLQYVYNKTRPEAKGKMISVATDTDRSVSCDIRPLSMPDIDGLRPRIHLWCTCGALWLPEAPVKALEGADGVVFVADSQSARLDANRAAWEGLEAILARQGRRLADLPLTLQYNKRDLPDVTSVAELDAVLNREGRPAFEAVASRGLGVFETLQDVARQVFGRARAGTL